jgi:hypothetical protein
MDIFTTIIVGTDLDVLGVLFSHFFIFAVELGAERFISHALFSQLSLVKERMAS